MKCALIGIAGGGVWAMTVGVESACTGL